MLIPSIATFLVTLINIAILFVILRALLFKPVTKFMADRSRKIEESLAGAESEKVQARQLLEQYQTQLKSADEEAEAILKSARENAGQEAERIVAEGKARAENLIAAARTRIDSEQQAALALFKTEAAALVLAAAGRLLMRDLSQEDDRRLAASLLKELSTGTGA
ncbi:MAG: F0F1 ATP synthase subunit B [Treponema sp.]|jgi:F-type H+-transporting ATPase subunit b|nr:F0F1 ATP synthase subunit B [Treponema sp.]